MGAYSIGTGSNPVEGLGGWALFSLFRLSLTRLVRLSGSLCVAVERQGSTITWTLCKAQASAAADGVERQNLTCVFGQRWIVKRRLSYAFSRRGAHFCLRRTLGNERRSDVAANNEHQSPAAKTTNSNSCDLAVAQVKLVKLHIPKQRSERTASAEPKSKKMNQINTKNYWK